jgi:peptidoglycan-associated lipoprotein
MGACANKNGPGDAMASAATPGSQQDFVVNVGDRVFFESDQTDLSQQAINTLEKQAQWLQQYNRYAFTIEGSGRSQFAMRLEAFNHVRKAMASWPVT